MSKRARKKNKEKRDSDKRARRATNQARYAALAGTAANKKRKGARSSGGVRVHSRPCGNLACTGCYVNSQNDLWKAPRASCLWSKRFTSPKARRAGK